GGQVVFGRKAGWGGVGEERFQGGAELGDVGGERLVAASHGGHGGHGCLIWAGEVAGAEPGGQLLPLRRGKGGYLLPQLLRGGDDQAEELVASLGAGLDRAPAGHLQGADRLHRAITGLRLPRRLAV